MHIRNDTSKLHHTLQDFYNATGINIAIINYDLTPIANLTNASNRYCQYIQSSPLGLSLCKKSDAQLLETCRSSRQPEMRKCRAGLMDIAIPIIHNDIILAFVIMGQIRADSLMPDFHAFSVESSLDECLLSTLYTEKPQFEAEKLESVANIAVMLIKYILVENMLSPNPSEVIEKAEAFINANLRSELTVQSLSKGTHISKSVLYKNFRQHLDCTVKEYINRKRIDASVDLLINTDLSIETISQSVGFSGSAYFCRIFKQYKGISPLQFRKCNA